MVSWGQFLLTPPIFADEDKTQLAGLLHRILLFSIVSLIITGLGMIMIDARQTQQSAGYVALTLIVDFIGIALLYRGYVRIVGYTLALATWVLCSSAVLLMNGLKSPALGFLVFTIIFGFLILGRRPGVFFLGLSLLTLIFAFMADMIVGLPAYNLPRTGIILAYTLIFSISAWVVDVVTLNLRHTIQRARDAEHALRRKSDLQTLVTQLSTEFVNMPPDEIQANIQHGMARVSEFVGADACRIWLYSDDHRYTTLIHEWHTSNLPSMMSTFTEAHPTEPYAWLLDATFRGETVIVPDTTNLPIEAHALKHIATQATVNSAIYVPLVESGRTIGSIAYSMVHELTDWTDEMIQLLTMAGMIFYQALERQKADEQRHALIAERERTAAIHEFIGNVTHDIKNPLAVVQTNLYVARHAATTEKRQQSLNTIEQQANRINVLVEDLLMIARLDTLQPFELKPTDLRQLLAEIADDLRPVAEDNGIEYTVDLAPTLPPVMADANDLRRAFVNLVENAVHYTPQSKSITLHASIGADGVIIRVTDTGIGIPAPDLPHIFDRFYRAENAESASRSGTGLGLAIVRQIIDKHQGQISVESAEGQGSTFSVILPTQD